MYQFTEGFNYKARFWFRKKYIEDMNWAMLSKRSQAIFPVICCHVNEKGIAFQGERTTAILSGIGDKYVRQAIRELESFPDFEWNYYTTTRGKRSKRFIVKLPQMKPHPLIASANELIMAADAETFIPGMSTVLYCPKANSLGAVSLDSDLDDFEFTTELATGNEDDIEFGRRELHPHPVAKRVKLSRTLVNRSGINANKLVTARLGYIHGVTWEKVFLTGHGSQQPLGVFTASEDGISTDRDVSTGNTTTSIKADGLIEAEAGLREPYRKKATWIFHPDAIKQVRKLKNGDGDYLWSPGIANQEGKTILGRKYVASEFAPNTFTTGQYVGIIGDFRYYWIAIALNLQIQVLNELYAETNQIGYIGRGELDGMPVLEEAFSRVKLA